MVKRYLGINNHCLNLLWKILNLNIQVDMNYTVIVLSLAVLTFALAFPTLESFIVGLENDTLPRNRRRQRKLMSAIVPRKITKTSRRPLFV